jgi:hypothetical protein
MGPGNVRLLSVHGSLLLKISQGLFFGAIDGKGHMVSSTASQAQYQAPLASFLSLSSQQSHTLGLVNAGTNAQSPRFDLDFVTITVGDGNSSYAFSTAEQRNPA